MRAPALVVATVGTLMVGLGLFAVVYTVVHKILIEPMPYRDPDDLYVVWRDYGPIFDLTRGALAGTDVAELQKAERIIEEAAGLEPRLATFAAREGMDSTEIALAVTTPNIFDLLGIQPVLGRGFARNEVGPSRPPVLVLTHQLWNRLGADPGIVDSVVRLNGQPYSVIGVMPSTFAFVQNEALGPPQRADAFTTFDINLAGTNPDAGSYAGLIRARRGTSPKEVSAAVEAVGRTVDARDFRGRGLRLYPVGLKPDLVSGVRPALLVLAFAGVFLVLVLMVNLASVLLARAAQREHEFAVSRALGANGAAVVRATLFEGGLLGLGGGAAAALAAIWGTRTLIALTPLDLPRRETVAVDWGIGTMVVGLGLLVGLLAAIAPATWAARATLSSLLASSAVRGGGGHGRMRRAMIVAQVTLSLVLLSAGGLVVRSFERLLRADPGFNPEGVLTVPVRMAPELIPSAADVLALQERIERSLEALPGVTRVSATSALPLSGFVSQFTISVPAAPGNTGNVERDSPLADVIGTRATYVETMGMRLVAGRTFDRVRHQAVAEALIDRVLARQFFPTGSPLGARILVRDRALTIVGVVDQARMYDLHQDGRAQVLVRAEDWDYRALTFVVRTERTPHALIPDVRSSIRRLEPRVAPADVRTMVDVIDDALRRQRISAVLISSFALGALLLAAMGLFGVVSGSVTRRRRELALRLAVGATHGRLIRLVLQEGAGLVVTGVLLGVPGIYVTGRVMRGVLVGVSPWDPLTLVAVAIGLGLVTMVACYVPARQVLRIGPAQSLREE
jgi:predicted permease